MVRSGLSYTNNIGYMKADKKYNKLFGLSYLLAILAIIVFLINNQNQFNTPTVVLPVCYLLCGGLFLEKATTRYKSKTAGLISICAVIRYAMLPMVFSFCARPSFGIYSTSNSALILKSVALMVYELFVLSIFTYFFAQKASKKTKTIPSNQTVHLGSGRIVLIFIAFIGIVVFLIVPSIRSYFSFISINANATKVTNVLNDKTAITTGLTIFSYYSMLSVFILLLDWFSKKYESTNRKKYILFSLFIGIIAVCIIHGESRATMVYSSFAVISSLVLKYPQSKKRIIRIMLWTVAAVVLLMTIYRLFLVYNRSSYLSAIMQGSVVGNEYIYTFFESYFLGPQTVSAGLEFAEQYAEAFTIERLLYDLFRPAMGINMLLKNIDFSTSIEMYNSWLFHTTGKDYGVFLQITNQGYCYFGFLLAPIFIVALARIAFFLERKANMTKSLFSYFFLNYVFVRLSTTMIGGTLSGYITSSTMVLLIAGAVYLVQRVFDRTTQRGMTL